MTLLDIEEDFNMLKADIKQYIEDTRIDISQDGCKCPFCDAYNDYKILDSRIRFKGRVRRKKCNVCNQKWNSVEVLERKIGYGREKNDY